MNSIQTLVQKMMAPLQRRVRLMIARAVIQLVDETKKCQTLQLKVHADNLRSDVERFQQYGFSSVPAPGAEALLLLVSGNSDHGVVVAVEDRRYRPVTLVEGESCLYTLQDGIRVWCKADGTLLLGTAPTDFVALASLVDARILALQARLDNHIHSTGTGPSSASTTPLGTQDTVTATEVKAK